MKGMKTGIPFNITLSGSDVANAFLQDPTGQDYIQLPVNDSYLITDMIFTGAGADTIKQEILVNGRQTPEEILNGANLATTYDRQARYAGIAFNAGSKVQFKQVA